MIPKRPILTPLVRVAGEVWHLGEVAVAATEGVGGVGPLAGEGDPRGAEARHSAGRHGGGVGPRSLEA